MAAKGSLNLENEVLNQSLCTSCGACVNICPYIKVVKDRVAVVEPCGITDGHCYDYCPRTPTDISELDRKLFGKERSDSSLGSYRLIRIAQAKNDILRARAQYGGVVSGLIGYALDSGAVQSAIMARPLDSNLMPHAVLVRDESEVVSCSGSSYVPASTLAALNQVMKEGHDNIGMVALPCQVLALRKMQASGHQPAADRVNLVIGLFCTWALSYKGIKGYLSEKVDIPSIRRLDIPPPPANILRVITSSGDLEMSLDDVRKFVKPTCALCFDMTSEFADISVGMVEGVNDWNTVIVRTPAGEKLFDSAREAGIAHVDALQGERLAHLREASALKKKRAIAGLIARSGNEDDLLYLRLSERERAEFR
ncbi:MAG: Coenzyme F420 hydrogenase/dehydrogenase, beta subunit C-terminal domain [Dehalococcoidia bacterium]|nr:Coenzyme F420 hydrogenase/dehydrogenase, beta subunit C-terminal domain [Dehalococcoidia bacterium]